MTETAEHVLLPTDFSPPSRAAMTLAVRYARLLGAKLTLLHVVDSRSVDVVPGHPPGLTMGNPDELERLAAERLAGERAQLDDDGLTIETVVRYGVPGQEMLEFVREHGVTLVVVGTHGRTGVVRALLGSQAEWIVRRSPVPVLTAHGATEEE